VNSEQLIANSEQLTVNSKPFTVHRSLFTVYCLLLLAFALRIHALEAQSIWWDEGISLKLARSTFSEILTDRLNNIHPPLYFILLKGWIALTGLNAFSGPTAFGGRYLSTLASLLQVATIYAVCRRWFRPGRSLSVIRYPSSDHELRNTEYGTRNTDHGLPITDYAPLLATILITFSPISIIYGQEARVYALLPLVTLALLAFVWEMVRRLEIRDWRLEFEANLQSPISNHNWVLFGLLEWFGLHLHYVMAFMVVYVSLWLMWLLWRQWADLRRFVLTQGLVGLACLPWFVAVLLNWTAVQAEANAGTYLSEPTPLDFLLKQVWVFQHTGLAGALGRPGIWPLSALILLLIVALFFLRLTDHRLRITTTRLLLQWLLPLSGALIVWTVRSFSHPRYIAFAAISFIPLAAFLIAPVPTMSRRAIRLTGQVLGATLFVVLLVLSLTGLYFYVYDPDFAKDDMRGTARYLQETFGADDLILAPDGGWAFSFEYQGETPIVMPEIRERGGLWTRLAEWTAVPRQIAILSSSTAGRDWQGVIPFALEQAGSLLETRLFAGLDVQIYEIEQPAVPPQFAPLDVRFGPLQLTGAWVEQGVAANTAVTLALRWQLQHGPSDRHHAIFTLTNREGLPLMQSANLLVDGDGRPSEQWPPGHVVTTTHVLPLPLGTPPLPINLRIGVSGESEAGMMESIEAVDGVGRPQGIFVLLPETITLAPANRPGSNPYNLLPGVPRLPEAVEVANGLWLTAAGQDRGQVSGGQTVWVSLEWQAQTAVPETPLQLQLVQAEQVLAESLIADQYPFSQWQPGEVVLEHHLLPVPAAVEAGTAVLRLVTDGQIIPIGEVEIVASDHNFAPPSPATPLSAQFADVARLVGFDLPQTTVSLNQPIPLNLYWQAMGQASPTAYTVFVHLLAEDGRLIGQHDSPPANGGRPTTGWIANEYIVDPHEISLRESGYAGPARLAIGLYDPITGTRLLMADGSDALVLPVTLAVEAEAGP
jgi:uncharacterized membrane protein